MDAPDYIVRDDGSVVCLFCSEPLEVVDGGKFDILFCQNCNVVHDVKHSFEQWPFEESTN